MDETLEPIQSDGAMAKRLVIAGAFLVVVLLIAAALVLRSRSTSELTVDSSSRSAGDAGTSANSNDPKDPKNIGGAIPDQQPGDTGPRSTIVLDDLGADSSSTTTSTAAGATTTAKVTTAAPSNPQPNNSTPTQPPPTHAPTTPAPTAPPTTASTNVFFRNYSIPATADCSDPMNPVPYLTISWDTPNATKVTVSIDGPGAYNSYTGTHALNHHDTFPFSCSGPHTYLLTAEGPGGPVTKSVTVTAA